MTESPPFADRLLVWWDVHGRKDLPWQDSRTPYRVWVSEVMLQQTQVGTVIPFFERFVANYPDLPDLAAASLDDVLAHWSGLGYYARARNLHEAARMCMAEYGGRLPDTADELTRLPGVGRSTANAIVSQTQDTPATVMDGNVKRVIARHAGVGGWPGKSAVLKTLLAEADSRLPATRGADYTQAIMDLGATVCTRADPRCPECPVRGDCVAFATTAVDKYPGTRPKADVPVKTLYMLVIRRLDGSVLLERRPPTGIWGGLWSLPEGPDANRLKRRLGVARATELPQFEHRLTHRLFKIHPLVAKSLPNPKKMADSNRLQWHHGGAWRKLGVPKPVLKILDELDD